MNKSDLIDSIADASGLSKADAGRALDGFTSSITSALKNASDSGVMVSRIDLLSTVPAAHTNADPSINKFPVMRSMPKLI